MADAGERLPRNHPWVFADGRAASWPALSSKLAPGQRVGVFYEDDPVWHERLLLAPVSAEEWVCRTPDGDQYAERLDTLDEEGCSRIALCSETGAAPTILAGKFYRFASRWDDEELRRMVAAALDQAKFWGGNMAEPTHVINAAGVRVPFRPWFAPGGRDKSLKPSLPSVEDSARVARHTIGDDDDDLDPGEGFVWISLEAGSGGTLAGQEVALVKGDARLGDRAIHVQSDGSMLCVKWVTVEQAAEPPATGGDEATDLRIMTPLVRTAAGKRWQTFEKGVERMCEEQLDDWPLENERSVSWLCDYIVLHGSTPDGRQTKWAMEQGIAKDHVGYILHDIVGYCIELAVCYDQIDLANCASFEILGRLYQLLEETGGTMVVEGLDHYIGRARTGGKKRGVAMAPGLSKSVAATMGAEVEVLKQRRKAREEEAAAKEHQKKGKQGPGPKGP